MKITLYSYKIRYPRNFLSQFFQPYLNYKNGRSDHQPNGVRGTVSKLGQQYQQVKWNINFFLFTLQSIFIHPTFCNISFYILARNYRFEQLKHKSLYYAPQYEYLAILFEYLEWNPTKKTKATFKQQFRLEFLFKQCNGWWQRSKHEIQ